MKKNSNLKGGMGILSPTLYSSGDISASFCKKEMQTAGFHMRKAQVGFFIILGIIIVAVIMILFVYKPPIIPPKTPVPLTQEQKMVKAYVEGIIKDGAVKNIKIIENQGGYFEVPAETVKSTLTLTQVPYWAKCGSSSAPELSVIESKLASLVENHLKNSLNKSMILYGKHVNFGIDEINIKTNIVDNKVDVTVNFPVKVEGDLIRAPYTASVPSMFGRIYKFASDFSKDSAIKRHFEVFTIQTIYASELRPFGLLVGCNNYYIKTPEEISEDLESVVYYVVKTAEDNLFERGKTTTKSPNFGIETINGEQYKDLKVYMNLPKGFSIASTDSIAAIPKVIHPEGVDYPISECAIYYHYDFSVDYPVIITAQDYLIDSTGNPFNFAIHVDVDKMKKGDCKFEESTCSDPKCTVKIKVTDGNGKPLKDAHAYSGNCFVGKSGADGIIKGKKPCGSGLTVIGGKDAEGEHPRVEDIDGQNIIDSPITLHRTPKLTFKFKEKKDGQILPIDHEEVMLEIAGSGGKYAVSNSMVEGIDVEKCLEAYERCERSTGNIEQCREGAQNCKAADNLLKQVSVDYIPGGKYTIKIPMLTNPRKVATENIKTYPFLAIPLTSTTAEITIPEEDGDIVVVVPNSDYAYDEAKRIYEYRVSHLQIIGYRPCHCGLFGCSSCPIYESAAQAKAEALKLAFNYLKQRFELKVAEHGF